MFLRRMPLLLVVLFHLLPLWPVLTGHYPLTVALALLVALPYIKTQKLAASIHVAKEELARQDPPSPKTQKHIDELWVSYRRFQALTLRPALWKTPSPTALSRGA